MSTKDAFPRLCGPQWQYAHGAPVAVVALDPYEWTNLMGALEAIMDGNSPLAALNSGDWVGQIRWKLPTREDTEKAAVQYGWRSPIAQPNASPENARQRAKDWKP